MCVRITAFPSEFAPQLVCALVMALFLQPDGPPPAFVHGITVGLHC